MSLLSCLLEHAHYSKPNYLKRCQFLKTPLNIEKTSVDQSSCRPRAAPQTGSIASKSTKPRSHSQESEGSLGCASKGTYECQQGSYHSSSSPPESNRMPTSRSGGRHPQGTYPASAFPSTNLYVSPFENTGHDPSNSPGPRSQQTPEVVLTEAEHDSDEEEDSSSSRSEDEDNAGGTEGSKSAAERLAEKRRMKRFRSAYLWPLTLLTIN